MPRLILFFLCTLMLAACASTGGKQLDTYLRPKADDVSMCYIQVLRENPAAKGEIELSVTVDGAGKVIAADLTKNTFPDDRVGKCVADIIKSVVFPPNNQNKTVTFSYPVEFNTEGSGQKQ